jgi:hypothetical protein
MKFPTTVAEALALDSEKAEELIYKIDELVGDKMGEYEPPEDFDMGEGRFALAHMIDVLNRISKLPDNPFGPEGWFASIPDDGEEG